MIPILANSYPYTGNGLGGLSDALECVVTHEVNGIYELRMRYPITGVNYVNILINSIIMAKPDVLTQAQPFRIYRITKPLNGVVTVYARHISYDMAGTIVEPFSSASLTSALLDLPTHCTPSPSFNITSTKSVASAFSLSEPRELWRTLGGAEGSFLDVYGGEWDFDLLDATLRTRLGTDRGVQIRYGKNLTELDQDATIESTYSGVWPYWYDEDNNTLVEITGKYVSVPGAVVSDRIMLLDCSADFMTAPTEQQLTDRANAYITANSVGSLKVSWKISFAMLAQAGEYETQAALEQVGLGDTLDVIYDDLGVNASSRVVKIDFDVLKDQYKTVTVGRVKQDLAAIIVGQNQEMDNKINSAKSELEKAVDRSTDFIRNGAGYMRLIYDSSDQLVEIVSLDDPDISQAVNVWRWNNGGFGFSNTGYNGTYGLALTQAGEIVADYITTGTLTANVIRAGILKDVANKNSWNLATGAFTITDGSINITTSSNTYDAISLTYNEWTAAIAPLQFYLENTSTKRKMLIQSGGLFNYDYSGGSDVQTAYLGGGVITLGASGTSGYEYLYNGTSGSVSISLDGSSGTVNVGSGGTNGSINVKDSSGTNKILMNGSSGNITSVNHTLGSSTLGAGTMFVNDASNNSVIVLDGANAEVTSKKLKLGGVLNGAGSISITNASNTAVISLDGSSAAITGQTLTLGGTATGVGNIKINRADGTNGMEFNPSLPAMIIKAANGTGYRTALADDGLYFYNASGTLTAKYGNATVTSTDGRITVGTSWTAARSITVTETGLYAVEATLSNNASGPRGVAILTRASSSSTTWAVRAVHEVSSSPAGGSYGSLEASAICYISANYEVWMYAKSASSASNNCVMRLHRIA